MSEHKAVKISEGHYRYRGIDIKKRRNRWYIDMYGESMPTLKSAKREIDLIEKETEKLDFGL